MQSLKLDIIDLIETNPITKLSKNYQGKFLEKIQNTFNETEQRLFVSSLYNYLNYDSKKDFIIELESIWKWLGFGRKEECKRVLIKHFTKDIDYKIITKEIYEEKAAPQVGGANFDPERAPQENFVEVVGSKKLNKETRGGYNKEKVLMTINTFKKLCLKSNTKKADEIHDYFIKLEELTLETITDESIELKNQLQEKDKQLVLKDSEKILEKHNLLLTRYAKAGYIVYFIKVKTYDNGSFILRVGQSTIGLEPRFNRHKSRYDEAIILECVKVDKSTEFESFIHNYLHNSLVKDLPGHENEKEIFLIKNQDEYNKLMSLVKNNITNFNKTEQVEIAHLQQEIIKLQNNESIQDPSQSKPSQSKACFGLEAFEQFDNKLLKQIIDNQTKMLQLICKITESQNKLENGLNTLVTNSNSKTTQQYNTLVKPIQGPRVLQINPDTLEIVKIFETIIEVINSIEHTNRNSLRRAVSKNSIYRNYRWKFVNRNIDVKDILIEQTNLDEEIKTVGYICKLNDTKTEIINVYFSMQEAVLENGKIAKNNECYILYEQCENILKQNFEEKYGKPLLYKNGVGQFDNNNNLIQDFTSKQDCFRKVNISRKLLDDLIKNNTNLNGFVYKYIGKKSKVIT